MSRTMHFKPQNAKHAVAVPYKRMRINYVDYEEMENYSNYNRTQS